MKRTLAVSAALFAAVFLIPLLVAGQVPAQPEEVLPSPSPSVPLIIEIVTPSPPPLPPSPALEMITVLVGGEPEEIALRDFLYGAVASEMPALYPEEALKAQAVVIRTFALYAAENPYHTNAALCAEWECCLAYSPLPGREEDWGDEYGEYARKIAAAVDETDGVAVYYQGELIEAVFFAASDGRTRSAAEVWGGEVPYLQSVASAFDLEFPGGPRGHGVGMSQFGARQLALEGLTCKEILEWYYTGIEVL